MSSPVKGCAMLEEAAKPPHRRILAGKAVWDRWSILARNDKGVFRDYVGSTISGSCRCFRMTKDQKRVQLKILDSDLLTCNVQISNIKLILMLLFWWTVGAKESGAPGKSADVHGFGGAGGLDPDPGICGNIPGNPGTKTRSFHKITTKWCQTISWQIVLYNIIRKISHEISQSVLKIGYLHHNWWTIGSNGERGWTPHCYRRTDPFLGVSWPS